MRSRAITGLGIVSAAGIGREAFVRAMHAPVPLASLPQAPTESFDGKAYAHARVAEVKNFDASKYLGDKGLRTLDRLTKLLVVSARLALHDAGFKKDGVFVQSSAARVGICCSNAYGSLEAITELDRVAKLEDARYINPAKFPNTVSNSASGYVSIWEDLRALNVAVSDGNCGALDAVACGDIYLETGRAEALLVGGAEAMSEALYLAFLRLGALEEGTHLGEGAALVAIEPTELADKRGAKRLADVTGYGTAFLPPEHEASVVHPSADAMERALANAIRDAGLVPGDIDLVASGVSGLRAFDRAELDAITRVLGEGVAVAAPKAILGETLGAGGGMAMAAGLAWLNNGLGSEHKSASEAGTQTAGKILVRGSAPPEIRSVAVTAMGFYGNASAVIMRRPL